MTKSSLFMYIFGIPIAPLSYAQTLLTISQALEQQRLLTIDTANTMVVSKAVIDPGFRTALNSFDLVVPDATPLIWYLRFIGFPYREPCYGPELTKMVIERFSSTHTILVIGSTEPTKTFFQRRFKGNFSWITKTIDPNQRSDIKYLTKYIHSYKPDIIFLALGCPKQYHTMAKLKPHLKHGVVIGVGGSIDLVAGIRPIAPGFIRLFGLNWLFRLALEPKRLWKRYLVYNALFLSLCIKHFSTDRKQTKNKLL